MLNNPTLNATDSGTEANEGALKFARKYGKQVSSSKDGSSSSSSDKVDIVSYNDGFHGRSLGSLSATWQEKYQAPFAPLLPGFKQGTYNDLSTIEKEIDENTCGVLLEPIQGEGGIMEAKEEWLRAVRKRCDEVNAVLIYDEIQVSGIYHGGRSMRPRRSSLRLPGGLSGCGALQRSFRLILLRTAGPLPSSQPFLVLLATTYPSSCPLLHNHLGTRQWSHALISTTFDSLISADCQGRVAFGPTPTFQKTAIPIW